MAWRVEFLRSAASEFEGIPDSIRQRVAEAIDRLEADPYFQGSKQLEGYPVLRRFRVGQWRIVYCVRADLITIARIARRDRAYRKIDRLLQRLG